MGWKWELTLIIVGAGAAHAAPARADTAAEFGKSQQAAPPAAEDDRDGTAPSSNGDSNGNAPRSDDHADAPAPISDEASDGTASTREEPPTAPELESEEAPPPAAPPEDPWTSHRFTLELQLGAGTPVGLIGMAGTYTVADELSFGAGLGMGAAASGPGADAAVFALLRPFHGVHNALVVDTALSTGSYARFDPLQGLMDGGGSSDHQSVSADWALWLQIALGWEYRGSGGTVVRITSGWARMLNPSARRCTARNYATGTEHPCTVGSDPEELGTFEFALGHAF